MTFWERRTGLLGADFVEKVLFRRWLEIFNFMVEQFEKLAGGIVIRLSFGCMRP